jgi:hypothetical protein
LLDNLTLAIFRKAELGFLGVIVLTIVTTPRLKGLEELAKHLSLALNERRKAVALTFFCLALRGFLMS